MNDPKTATEKTAIGPGEIPPPGLDEVQMLEHAQASCPNYLWDCLAVRHFPDGRLAALRLLLFGAQVCVGTMERLSEPLGAWDDVWDYETLLTGYAGMALWEPEQDAEPEGWIRHLRSGRRRAGGDPETEVRIDEEVRA